MSASTSKIYQSNRLFYFDFLRTVACLCVVMIHVSAEYTIKEAGSLDFWIGNLFDSISRAAVPLFVMISGALMLDEKYLFTREKWFKHIIKMLSFFLFWSTAYTLVFTVGDSLIKHEEISVTGAFLSILRGHYHLWFIPMIIGIYLIVPLLRLWVKQQNKQYVEYFLILSLVFSFIIPQGIQLLVCINSKFKLLYGLIDNMYIKYPIGYSSYFILGWYLHNYELPYKKLFYILGIAGICVTFLGPYGMYAYTRSDGFFFYSDFSVNVLLYAVAVFVLAKSIFGSTQWSSSYFHKAISLISKCSLGVYAVHAAVLTATFCLLPQMHVLIAIPITFIVSAASSVIVSLVISKIPFVRKFV